MIYFLSPLNIKVSLIPLKPTLYLSKHFFPLTNAVKTAFKGVSGFFTLLDQLARVLYDNPAAFRYHMYHHAQFYNNVWTKANFEQQVFNNIAYLLQSDPIWKHPLIKNYIQSYPTSLKKIKNILEITDEEHPYVKCLENLNAIVMKAKPTNIKFQLEALNAFIGAMLFKKEFKGLYPSLTSDADIDPNFKAFHKEFIQNATEKAKYNIMPHQTSFPKDSKPDAENIIAMVKELIKFFPEEEQTSMWHNFERFGVPLIKET